MNYDGMKLIGLVFLGHHMG